jgi:PRTRC genetic system protein E
MFTELMPLLGKRTVMITVARIDENTIRVNFIPSKSDDKTESPALNQPLTITGTPAELDRQLTQQLSAFAVQIAHSNFSLATVSSLHQSGFCLILVARE